MLEGRDSCGTDPHSRWRIFTRGGEGECDDASIITSIITCFRRNAPTKAGTRLNARIESSPIRNEEKDAMIGEKLISASRWHASDAAAKYE